MRDRIGLNYVQRFDREVARDDRCQHPIMRVRCNRDGRNVPWSGAARTIRPLARTIGRDGPIEGIDVAASMAGDFRHQRTVLARQEMTRDRMSACGHIVAARGQRAPAWKPNRQKQGRGGEAKVTKPKSTSCVLHLREQDGAKEIDYDQPRPRRTFRIPRDACKVKEKRHFDSYAPKRANRTTTIGRKRPVTLQPAPRPL